MSGSPATTGTNGQASVTATASTIAGSYTVTASVSGVATPASFSLTNTPGAAASVAVISGSPQSTTVGQPFTNPLLVVVEDKYSNPVPNVTVTFAAPTSGAAAIVSSSTATTGSNGQASFTAMANGIAGTYTVTVSVSGVATPASFALTQTLPATGVSVIGTTLYIVGGSTSSDTASVKPAGVRNDGSTGLTVSATLNRVSSSKSFTQPFTAIIIAGYAGNETFTLAPTLTLPTTVTAGNGNDVLQLGGGDSIVVLGDGNDTVSAGGGNNTVTLGNGNDVIQLGDGSNVVVEGNGNDSVSAGNGNNLIVGGLGHHTITVGNGTNILIDGSATVNNSGDSLRQILNAWTANPVASNQAAIRSRFTVSYNSRYHQHPLGRQRHRLVLLPAADDLEQEADGLPQLIVRRQVHGPWPATAARGTGLDHGTLLAPGNERDTQMTDDANHNGTYRVRYQALTPAGRGARRWRRPAGAGGGRGAGPDGGRTRMARGPRLLSLTPTAISVSAASAAPVYGQVETFTATVTTPSGDPTPDPATARLPSTTAIRRWAPPRRSPRPARRRPP